MTAGKCIIANQMAARRTTLLLLALSALWGLHIVLARVIGRGQQMPEELARSPDCLPVMRRRYACSQTLAIDLSACRGVHGVSSIRSGWMRIARKATTQPQ